MVFTQGKRGILAARCSLTSKLDVVWLRIWRKVHIQEYRSRPSWCPPPPGERRRFSHSLSMGEQFYKRFSLPSSYRACWASSTFWLFGSILLSDFADARASPPIRFMLARIRKRPPDTFPLDTVIVMLQTSKGPLAQLFQAKFGELGKQILL